MRVIAGIAKGRRLRTSSAKEMRPTTDRARQVIFDILKDAVLGARVLDLFAGSGALGIEALSRGARDAVFVDHDRVACDVILQNLNATGLRGQASIRRADALRFLARRAGGGARYDLVFFDPPYDRGLPFVARALAKLAEGSWVRPGGTVVVEAPSGQVDWPRGFREVRTRSFGRTHVSMAVVDESESEDGGDLSGDF